MTQASVPPDSSAVLAHRNYSINGYSCTGVTFVQRRLRNPRLGPVAAPLGGMVTVWQVPKASEAVQTALRSASSRLSHWPIRFQLVKIRLTTHSSALSDGAK
jgi:hypothetical protein